MVSRFCRASRVSNKKRGWFHSELSLPGQLIHPLASSFPRSSLLHCLIYIRSQNNEWLQNYPSAPKPIPSEVIWEYVSGCPYIAGEGWWLEVCFYTRDTPHAYRPHRVRVPGASREQWKKLHQISGFGTHLTLLSSQSWKRGMTELLRFTPTPMKYYLFLN